VGELVVKTAGTTYITLSNIGRQISFAKSPINPVLCVFAG
jgi:hypothetical protein